MRYAPYRIAIDEPASFCSADILFKSDFDGDNSLYLQRTNGRNEIVDFVVCHVDGYRLFFEQHEFALCVGRDLTNTCSIGDQAIYCFADFEGRSCIFIFADRCDLNESECFRILSGKIDEHSSGAILEFFYRAFDQSAAARFVSEIVKRPLHNSTLKAMVYLFLCGKNDLNSAILVDFYRYGEILGQKDRSPLAIVSTRMDIKRLDKLRSALTEIIDGESVRIVERVENLPTKNRTQLPLDAVDDGKSQAGDRTRNVAQAARRTRATSPSGEVRAEASRDLTGADIAALRKRHRLSRRELGSILGVSADRVRKWETKYERKVVTYRSTALTNLVQARPSPSDERIRWNILAGKSRKRMSTHILGFFGHNASVAFAIEYLLSDDRYSWITINPFTSAFQDDAVCRYLFGITNPAEREQDPVRFQDIEFLEDSAFDKYLYLCSLSKNGDAVRIVSIFRQFRDSPQEFMRIFNGLFLDRLDEDELKSIRAERVAVVRHTLSQFRRNWFNQRRGPVRR